MSYLIKRSIKLKKLQTEQKYILGIAILLCMFSELVILIKIVFDVNLNYILKVKTTKKKMS